jgi:hypothetical protein
MDWSAHDPDGDLWLGRVRRTVAPLCDSCVASTDVGGGGVALLSSSGVRAVVHTTDSASAGLEALQLDLGEGPCIDAAGSATPVLVGDLRDPREGVASRWPFFLPRVDELGIRAVFAFPLHLGSVRLGTLELYRARPGSLTPQQLSTALRAADDIGSAVVDLGDAGRGGERSESSGRPYLEELQGLGRSAAVVHQAAGMVMVQVDGTIDEAMAILRAGAFADGLSLTELSTQVVTRHRRFSKEQT